MSVIWAQEFGEILPTLQQRPDLRERFLELLSQPTAGKVLEGGERLAKFRGILADLANGELSLEEAYAEVAHQLPRSGSAHGDNNKVFPAGWEERLVRTHLSRFYCHAVLEHLQQAGETRCFVPHSSAERSDSPCSQHIAGREHGVADMLERLVANYSEGRFSKANKIPEHPHCTHVITPVRKAPEA